MTVLGLAQGTARPPAPSPSHPLPPSLPDVAFVGAEKFSKSYMTPQLNHTSLSAYAIITAKLCTGEADVLYFPVNVCVNA